MTGAREPRNDQEAGSEGGAHRYVVAGLETLGVQAGEAEVAVIEAVDAIYRPALDALLADGLDGVDHEPGADMSQPPRTPEGR